MVKYVLLLIGAISMVCSPLSAMVWDNRHLPLIAQPFFYKQDARFLYAARAVFMGADASYSETVDGGALEDEIPLFQINGQYDEVQLDKSLLQAGITTASLFRTDMQSIPSLPWLMPGKTSFNGADFHALYYPLRCWGFGINFLFGKLNSHLELQPNFQKLPPGDKNELIRLNKTMHDLLHVTAPCYNELLFGDIDLYTQFKITREYWHKIHRLDVEFNLGALIPTAKKAPINNPAAFSIGGNGHWGIYGNCNGRFILKDDVTVAILLQVNKRFAKTSYERMPINNEPINYGTIVAPARVNPGVTVIFSPRVQLDGLRQGLGFNVAYILIHHTQDYWKACGSEAPLIPNVKAIESRSSWGADYFSVSALYDFGYDKENSFYAPIVSVTADIPFKGLVTQRVNKSHGISLRIESRL